MSTATSSPNALAAATRDDATAEAQVKMRPPAGPEHLDQWDRSTRGQPVVTAPGVKMSFSSASASRAYETPPMPGGRPRVEQQPLGSTR
jgi:hypothetical protein